MENNAYYYRILFSKRGSICFVGHLDFMTVLRRAIKRAGLPVKYSEGFNPHMQLSIALPLAMRVEGLNEYADFTLTEYVPPDAVTEQLNAACPEGVVVKQTEILAERKRTTAAYVTGAEYEVFAVGADFERLKHAVNEINAAQSVIVCKKTKSGEKMTDIRQDIFSLDLKDTGTVVMRLAAGSERNIKPELVMERILEGNSCDDVVYVRNGLVLSGIK